MHINSAEYTASIAEDDPILKDPSHMVSFWGRSNVGKSSLINALLGKVIAKSSSTPGKTKRMYFYRINDAFYFIDLPGYGYAKLGGEKKSEIGEMLSWFAHAEEFGVRSYIVVIDGKIGPTQEDLEVIATLTQQQKRLLVVANKIDKVSNSYLFKHKQEIQAQIGSQQILWVSTTKRTGLEEVWEVLMS